MCELDFDPDNPETMPDAKPRLHSELEPLLVCENLTCRYHISSTECGLLESIDDCSEINKLEIPESPWHKEFKNSTQELRTKWDIENRTH